MKRYHFNVISPQEIEMKTTIRYYFKPTKVAMMNNLILSIDRDVRQMKLSCTAGRV